MLVQLNGSVVVTHRLQRLGKSQRDKMDHPQIYADHTDSLLEKAQHKLFHERICVIGRNLWIILAFSRG